MTKVFQIGFNKCGTTSLAVFFRENGMVCPKSAHNWQLLRKNIDSKSDPVKGLTDDKGRPMQGFFDMTFDLFKEFKYIYTHYPDAIYILNTRNIDDWIKSRLNHNHGRFLERSMKSLNLDKDGVVEYWKKEWTEHHDEVRTFFDNKSNFYEFNIDNYDMKHFCSFIGNYIELSFFEFPTKNTSEENKLKFSKKKKL